MKSLYHTISDTFSLDELPLLCADAGIKYDNVPGDTLDSKALALVEFCQRHGRFSDLYTALQQLRPHIDWRACPVSGYGGTAAAQRHYALPPRPDHFTGREAEITALTDAIYPGKRVTLWAAGGMGKTTLAVETIYRLRDHGTLNERFPDGVHFFSFYGRSQNENLYQDIVTRFDPSSTDFSFVHSQRLLEHKRLLLTLDGAEEAEDFDRALQLQGENGLFVTTRDRRIRGGTRIEVGLLPQKEAVQLLHKWSVGALDDKQAEAFCQVIGRLPLALQIVGAYLDETGEPPDDYLNALKETPIRELHRDDKQSESVDILLKRTVAQLDEAGQTALALLGCLALLPVQEVVLQSVLARDARPALASLHRFGLAIRETGTVRLTHALIHAYAKRRLPLVDHHLPALALYWTELVNAECKNGPEGFERLHPERPHLLALLRACEARQAWQPTKDLIRCLTDYLYPQGLVAAWIEALNIGIRFARVLDDRRGEGIYLGNLGVAYSDIGEYEKAVEYYEQALAISHEIGHREGEAAHMGNLASIIRHLGQLDKAISYYEQALAISREIGDPRGEGAQLGNLGNTYRELGKVDIAVEYYNQALAIAHEIGDRHGESRRLGNLGTAYAQAENFEQALAHHQQALAISREIGNRQGEGFDLSNLGMDYRKLGQVDKAKACWIEALQIFEEIQSPHSSDVRGWLDELQNDAG